MKSISLYNHRTTKSLKSEILLNEKSKIIFGNSSADLTLTAVTSPLSFFCATTFNMYDHLLETMGDSFQMSVIFNVSPNSDPNDYAAQISQRIIEFYLLDPSLAYSSLKDCFSNHDVNKWLDKYGASSQSILSGSILTDHYKWCREQRIKDTPITIIGNNLFPKEYDAEDLVLFMYGLLEEI